MQKKQPTKVAIFQFTILKFYHGLQAPLRHIEVTTYRCFLPDLAGFMSLHCARLKDRGTTLKSIKHLLCYGGERGIRTLGTVSNTHAFQACSFNHSDISPMSTVTLNILSFKQNYVNVKKSKRVVC